MMLKLDFSSEVPIYLQIRNQIVMGVADGRLKPGERLPTIRALADEAGVNTMTVNKAYALLKSEGVIVADRRSGARVREPENGGAENGGAEHGSAETGNAETGNAENSGAGARGAVSACSGKHELSERTMMNLRLVIAEAKLAGMKCEEFLDLCTAEFTGGQTVRENRMEI